MAGAPDPMRWKKHWGQYSGQFDNRREIETYDNLQAEYAGIVGTPIIYYTLHVDSYKDGIDIVAGDNPNPVWDRAFDLTAIQSEWSKEPQSFTQFGLENIDEMFLYVHRSTYDRLIGWRSGETPVQSPNLTTRPSSRGGYGPIPKDVIQTVNNGIYYEVVSGGLHFLESNAQHFGHKFWYKLTLKVREASPPIIGHGEQYGPVPVGMTLQDYTLSKGLPGDYYSGNSQFLLPTPDCDDIRSTFTNPDTNPISGADAVNCETVIEYTTVGSSEGPADLADPDPNINLPDGRVANKYLVKGPKPFSNKGDNDEIQSAANTTVNPQTNLVVTPTLPSGRPAGFDGIGTPIYTDTTEPIPTDSDDYKHFIGYYKYGPTGKVLRHKRELWGDW